MIAAQDLSETHDRPPAVGLKLRVTTNAVYTLLQKGALDGVCDGGRWWVSRESVRQYLERRQGTAA